MTTLYQYLAIIGWVWCAIALTTLIMLVRRKKRMESLSGFEVAPVRPDNVAPDDSHAK